MSEIILFLISAFGLSMIVIDSSLFEPVRNFLKGIMVAKAYELFECYLCFGVWAGWMIAPVFIELDGVSHLICLGFAAGAFSFVSHKIVKLIHVTEIFIKEKID
jgi:hypothetical protein